MPTYTPLQSIVLTSTSGTVTFSNIPQTYQDLILVISGTNTIAGAGWGLQFNGDTAANYSWTLMEGSGSSATSSRSGGGVTKNSIYMAYNQGTSEIQGNAIVSINNYSNSTTYKTCLIRENNPNGATYPGVSASVGLWRNTAAITSITAMVPGALASYGTGTTFDLYGISPAAAQNASATGGTDIFYDSTYVYHVYKASGTFTPARALSADILTIAGGGSGGGGADAGLGGGGAGGLYYASSQSLTSGTSYTVTVGAGAATVSSGNGNQGSNSQFGSLTAAVGGGYGATSNWPTATAGGNGGSGGGGRPGNASGLSGSGGTATSGQGNNGGSGYGSGGSYGIGGAGGGAGAIGGDASASSGGNGGAGSSSYSSWGLATSTGENVSGTYYYAGGGGGGGDNRNSAGGGTGGSGGGGRGGNKKNSQNPGNGITNTGGGGGGTESAQITTSGSGGSGIVIVRYAR